jgi:hypothetical protein
LKKASVTRTPLPNGFSKLLEMAIHEDPISERALPKQTERIWSDFAYCILLGENRSDADVGYLYDLLDIWGLLDMHAMRVLTRFVFSKRCMDIDANSKWNL